MSNYPTLRLGVLQGLSALKASCDAEPGYLRKAECPYDNDTVKLLEQLFQPKTIVETVEKFIEKPAKGKVGRPSKKRELGEDEVSEVENETKELLKELRNLDKDMAGEKKQLDTATKLSIYKTRAMLLEKLVTIRERFTAARKVVEFMDTVMGILDDLVPEERRAEMMTRLEPYR
jgi:hypothetical protein